nr:MAG TPA: hypothetical protein [Caudoviricetes sp.]
MCRQFKHFFIFVILSNPIGFLIYESLSRAPAWLFSLIWLHVYLLSVSRSLLLLHAIMKAKEMVFMDTDKLIRERFSYYGFWFL